MELTFDRACVVRRRGNDDGRLLVEYDHGRWLVADAAMRAGLGYSCALLTAASPPVATPRT
jgi:hypothetical protein